MSAAAMNPISLGKPRRRLRGRRGPDAGRRGLRGDRRACLAISATSRRFPLRQALGRVLATPVTTRTALPRFDHSAVDGYGLSAADVGREPPFDLRVDAEVAAGGTPRRALQAGAALRLFTGAPVPPDVAGVVLEERCRRTRQLRRRQRAGPGRRKHPPPRGGCSGRGDDRRGRDGARRPPRGDPDGGGCYHGRRQAARPRRGPLQRQ